MTESEARAAIVAEAKSWIGTPYHSNAMVKGPRGGTDCAMLILAVYQNIGLLPKDLDPRPYPPMWHVHRSEERYMNAVLRYAKEVTEPKAGDLAMFKIGLAFAHGAIVTEWPFVIHAIGGGEVLPEDISKNTMGKRALAVVPRKLFSLWPGA